MSTRAQIILLDPAAPNRFTRAFVMQDGYPHEMGYILTRKFKTDAAKKFFIENYIIRTMILKLGESPNTNYIALGDEKWYAGDLAHLYDNGPDSPVTPDYRYLSFFGSPEWWVQRGLSKIVTDKNSPEFAENWTLIDGPDFRNFVDYHQYGIYNHLPAT
jgi:hypothetical protein